MLVLKPFLPNLILNLSFYEVPVLNKPNIFFKQLKVFKIKKIDINEL